MHASVAAAAAAGYANPRGIELTVARTRDSVRIEVADSACGSLPVPSAPSADEESGRGMQVISALSKRWGCWSGQLGKVVWCELAAASLGPADRLPAVGQVLAAGQVLVSAGCIDLSWPGSVAV